MGQRLGGSKATWGTVLRRGVWGFPGAGTRLAHLGLAGMGRQGWCDCFVLFGWTSGSHAFTTADC